MKGKIVYNPILLNMLNPLVLETYVEGNRTLKDSIKIPEVIGILSIEYIRTNPSGNNVYSIKLTNGLSYEIIAPKGDTGVGVLSVKFTRTESNGDKVYTIKLDNGTDFEFVCPKGSPGTTNYNELENKPFIPTKVSELQNDSGYTTSQLVQLLIANLVNSAPQTLDTLKELADALNNDPNFANTIAAQIGQKYTKPLSGIPASDLSDAVKNSLDKADTSQPLLVSGTNIKTINNLSLLGSGNLDINGGISSWDEIEDKPDFSTVATSGSYNDLSNKPTIPDVTGKADKVSSATNGHLAGLNASGNLTDSGIVPSTLIYQGVNQGAVPSVDFDPEADTVHVTAQTLSSTQQQQARTNIGAGTSSFSGSYNDLTNKPTIPDTTNFVQKSQTSGLLKNDGTVDTSIYLTSAHEVPAGGNSGQVLKKSSATDYDYAWANQTQDYPSAYCKTAAGTAGKTATCTLWTATANTYLHIVIVYANTSASALTLNVNSTSAAPIYINGVVSSSTNYTLPAGSYIAFYDGANWYINTDGTIPNVLHKSNTSGLVKNDGTIDTNTYLTSHQDISGKADKIMVVDVSTLPSSLDPNKVYQMGTLTGSVTIPAFSAVASGDTEAKIWCFTFNTSTTAPTITWPAAITNWVGGLAPTINASKSYEVTVMDGIGAIMEA